MADNIAATVTASIATDDIGGVHFQRFKLAIGADGVNDGDVSAANPLPVEIASGGGLTDAELRATPVDVAGTVMIDDSTPVAVAVDGTVPVSVAATLNTSAQPDLVVEKIDQASATVTYIGQAAPGAATSAASWRIQRMSVSGTVTTMEYADGDLSFNNIWDNRASLSYS